MPWWGWIVVSAVLLGAELALIDAEFYLVFLGVAAFAVGVGVIALPELPIWLQWLAFAVLAVGSMVGFRSRVYAKLRGSPEGFGDGIVGELATASEPIAPGETGRGELRGTVWTLHNVGEAALAAGDGARVAGVRGLVLEVASRDV